MTQQIAGNPNTQTEGASAREEALGGDIGLPAQRRPNAPVILWAALGAVTTAIIVGTYARWVTSSDFTPTPAGPDEFSTSHRVILETFQVAVAIIAAVIAWKFLLRPLIRDRTLTFDGTLVLAAFGMFYFDIGDNFITFNQVYNAHFVQFGSWARWVPGWQTPNGQNFVEPIIVVPAMYISAIVGTSMSGCHMIQRLDRRYPTRSTLTHFCVVYAAFVPFFFLMEMFVTTTELWVYPGIPDGWALFAGETYQYPIYEPFIVALLTIGYTAFRYSYIKAGRSFAEIGVDTLRCGQAVKKLISTFAIFGFAFFWLVVGYFIPYNVFAAHDSTFVDEPSYLRSAICGPGTDYPCPVRGR